MSRVASRFLVVTMATLLATGWLSARPQPAQAVSPDIVISQIYGGGGNAGATYNRKFVELFNRGSSAVSLNGKSLQYASATGTGNFGIANQIVVLPNASIAAGGYYLIGLAIGANGAALPATPDLDAGTGFGSNPAAASGKLIVANTTTSLGCNGGSTPCSAAQLAQIVDLVGYGTANFFEGAGAAPTLSATAAGQRAGAGCTDTDHNNADFAAATPAPRNSSTAANTCGGGPALSINDVSQAESDSGSTGFLFTVTLSGPAGPGGVTFDVTTADGTAVSAASEDYTATSLADETIVQGQTSTSFSVPVTGDTAFEPDETFFVNVTGVTGATVADGQGLGTIQNDDEGSSCEQTFTPIYSIQGDGLGAAITGTVTTQGVVVGDFETGAAGSGFYLQDPLGDGDSDTSDGIFVFTGTGAAVNTVSAGDSVRVTGFARERFPVGGFGLTSITGAAGQSTPVPASDIVICGEGSVKATDVVMPFASSTYLERFEGMLVNFPQELVIAEYFNYDRFGELVLALPLDGDERPFTGTAREEPGAAANARAAANLLRRITLDDVQSAQNPPILRHPNGDKFALENRFRGGDIVKNAVGVLGFDFSLYRILPTGPADYAAANPRPEKPEDVGGSLKVAAMNTLNFFLTIDTTDSDSVPGPCGGNANLDCRGADDDPPQNPAFEDELTRQRDKLILALAGIDADVLGLNELENTPSVDPLGGPNGIVEGLNDLLGAGTYAAIDTDTIGTDAIKVGLIYKPGVVAPVGGFEILDSSDDPRFLDNRSRPALAQTFEEIATGGRFTVVVNHLKSKGESGLAPSSGPPGICNDADPTNDTLDCDQLDGQGFWNFTRLQAARALVDWVASDPTGSGDPDFLIIGDLNSYAREDPIDAIKAGADDTAGTADDWTNLIAQFVGSEAYSFVFDGQAGYLDHALANATIADQVTGATEWHINADEPDILDYDVSFKPAAQEALYEVNEYRTSDHDPLIVGLNLINEAPTIEVSAGSSCSNIGFGGAFQLTVDDNEVAAADLELSLENNTNATLVPNVTFGGSGATRTVAITVAGGQSGTATLTIGVNDGFQTTTTTITVMAGAMGSDSLTGGSGADLLIGGLGGDTLSGAGGADVLCGGHGADALSGGDGNDALEGEHGADTLSGGDGNDVLRGGQGDDALAGNAGNDTLTGNAGADSFSGGAGSDTNTDVTPSQGDTTDGT